MAEPMPTPVRAAIDAANAGDVDAFLDAFGEDGVVDDWGREFRGRAQIRGWSDQEFIGKRVSLDVTEHDVRGDETVVNAQVGGDGFTGPSHFTFAVDGDRLTRMTIRA